MFAHSNTTQPLPATLWSDWDEFHYVYHNLFHHYCSQRELPLSLINDSKLKSTDSLLNLQHAHDIIEMWRSRDPKRVPICVDATQQMMYALYLFVGTKQSLRRLLSSSISRVTNRLLDPRSRQSTAEISKALDFPFPILRLRHDIVHESLPSLHVLRQHALYLLKWLHSKYWQFQMDRVDLICHRNMKKRIINLKACPWTDGIDTKRVDKAVMTVMDHVKDKMGGSHVAVMRYIIPFLVEECLLDTSCLEMDHHQSHQQQQSEDTKKSKQKQLNLQSREVVERVFTALYMRYNTLIMQLINISFVVLPHLLIILMQKRHSMLTSPVVISSMSNVHALKCRLLIIWCSSLLTDDGLRGEWKNKMSKEQIVFCLENMLKFAMPFSDAMSREMIQNIKRQAKITRCDQDIAILKQIKVLQKFVEPVKDQSLKLKKDIKECLMDRKEAEERCRLLMEKGIITKLKDEESGDDDDEEEEEDGDEDSDMEQDQDEESDDDGINIDEVEQDTEMQAKDEEVKCKWELSSDCKFLPIGHSVLPPF